MILASECLLFPKKFEQGGAGFLVRALVCFELISSLSYDYLCGFLFFHVVSAGPGGGIAISCNLTAVVLVLAVPRQGSLGASQLIGGELRWYVILSGANVMIDFRKGM